MQEQVLEVVKREGTGKGRARKLRQTGKIPGIIYGGKENFSVICDPRILTKILLEEGGKNRVLQISGVGSGIHALIKDYQVDPVKRNLLHIDLLEIDVKNKVNVTVKLNFVGKAAGLVNGGIVNIVEREVEVRCLPTQIPQHIDVDISPLNIGESIHGTDLVMPEGVELVAHDNETIVTVVPPAKDEVVTADLTPGAEPEVITEKKDKDEKKDKKDGE